MCRTSSILLAAGALLSTVHPVLASPKVVSLSFEKHVSPAVSALQRRQNSYEIPVGNAQILYFINVTIGTPPQDFTLQLDTGSSDTWIPSVSSDICTLSPSEACLVGSFNASGSRTFVDVAEGAFEISYVDGSQIQGDYFQDTLQMGDSFKLEELTLGLAKRASRGLGVMGIAYRAGEAIAAVDPELTYPNIIDQLVLQGITKSRAYSLYLDDVDANYGNILFGGVDSNKYSGDLVALPVQPDNLSGELTSFTVAFTGLSVVDGSGNNQLTREGIAVPAILDSGTSYTYLPDDLANAVLEGVGVTTDPQFGNVIRCRVGREDATFKFEFGGQGGPAIDVPLSQLVTPIVTLDRSIPTFDDGQDACNFGIYSAGNDPILFGDSFMRAAYVVYDLENDLIAVAQAKYDSPDSNIQEFSAGGTIPNIVSIASDVGVTQTYTGPLPSQPATGTATGTEVVGTERSPTFRLGDGSGSQDAALPVVVPVIEATTMVACVLIVTSMAFGGGFLIYM